MTRELVLTKESFDKLLEWLDTDRERAALNYEQIRLRLIKIFARRGCGEAEDLADETINRVATKVDKLVSQYVGNPALYFYGVAQKVHHEYIRSQNRRLPQSSSTPDDYDESEYECLDRCLQVVPSEDRDLVLRYYLEDKQAKINYRKQLADELGIALNALRIRVHRIRMPLKKCVHDCVQSTAVN